MGRNGRRKGNWGRMRTGEKWELGEMGNGRNENWREMETKNWELGRDGNWEETRRRGTGVKWKLGRNRNRGETDEKRGKRRK